MGSVEGRSAGSPHLSVVHLPPPPASPYLGRRLPGGRAGRARRSRAAPSSGAGPWLCRDKLGGGLRGENFPDFIIRAAPAQGSPQQRCSGGGEGAGVKGSSWGWGRSAGSSPPSAASPGTCGAGTTKSRAEPAAEPLPERCAPRQGRGREAQGAAPPAPPARPGSMGAGSPPLRGRAKSLGAGGGPSPALSSCLGTSPPRRLRATQRGFVPSGERGKVRRRRAAARGPARSRRRCAAGGLAAPRRPLSALRPLLLLLRCAAAE